ncbi:hypothetical protein AXB20_22485 [Salmonella enterica]|nr:hypothetical protein [Salmonella enterica]ECK1294889.1 hypothetical protein [Salmonella enterica subsp. enterica serovar Typhimurium]EDB8399394.1 hypothetical protein [Salmonella enterica subsp. enterica serovar Heidelberg]EDD2261874.1 hypothetical protein [Salmonella enterica subsp. enterica serovar Muenchen]EDE3701794.1 hypothetical protein [Salmonella enterica subsp. enterica serovar Schwarzengrund]EDQ3279466.1 hypothetical protein [Salmonella enterica subsp. enterica serovar Saintpaul]
MRDKTREAMRLFLGGRCYTAEKLEKDYLAGGTSENGIYGHSRFCNTDFDDKLACLNLSGV